jgi:acyl-coenzyme A synthetase/AMP-(fatty) acid ligase
VKLRGFRIELGEVENILRAQEGVKQCLVTLLEDRRSNKRLVGYVVAEAGIRLTAAKLREGLQAKLPEYMIPAAFQFLDALPLTPNGKIDRRALPPPIGERLDEKDDEPPGRLWRRSSPPPGRSCSA